MKDLKNVSVNGSARVLVLCHRSELVDQARARLEQMTGEYVEVELADLALQLRGHLQRERAPIDRALVALAQYDDSVPEQIT